MKNCLNQQDEGDLGGAIADRPRTTDRDYFRQGTTNPVGYCKHSDTHETINHKTSYRSPVFRR